MQGSEFDEGEFFRAIAASGSRALLIGRRALVALGIPVLTGLGIVTAILQMILVILLRAHWTLDVVAGLFAAVMVGALSWSG